METDVCRFHDFCLWGEKYGCGNGTGYLCPAARSNPEYLQVRIKGDLAQRREGEEKELKNSDSGHPGVSPRE